MHKCVHVECLRVYVLSLGGEKCTGSGEHSESSTQQTSTVAINQLNIRTTHISFTEDQSLSSTPSAIPVTMAIMAGTPNTWKQVHTKKMNHR